MGEAQIVGLVELVEREGTVKQEAIVELVKLAVLEDTVVLDLMGVLEGLEALEWEQVLV